MAINNSPGFPEVAQARRKVELLEGELKSAREALLAAAVRAVMSDPGAYGQIAKVAREAGFSDAYLGRALTEEQRRAVKKARAARVRTETGRRPAS